MAFQNFQKQIFETNVFVCLILVLQKNTWFSNKLKKLGVSKSLFFKKAWLFESSDSKKISFGASPLGVIHGFSPRCPPTCIRTKYRGARDLRSVNFPALHDTWRTKKHRKTKINKIWINHSFKLQTQKTPESQKTNHVFLFSSFSSIDPCSPFLWRRRSPEHR